MTTIAPSTPNYPTTSMQKVKVGDLDSSGRKIKRIIAASDSILVYLKSWNNELALETTSAEATALENEVCREMDSLDIQIKRTIPAGRRRMLRIELGSATFHALSDPDVSNVPRYFAGIKRHLQVRALAYSQFYFVFYGLLYMAFTIMTVCFLVLYIYGSISLIPPYLLGAPAGAVGAAIAICLRPTQITPDFYGHRGFIAFHGIIRAFLGSLFGVLIILAVRGQIILGIFNETLPAMLILALVAGFSETFLPNLLAKLERQIGSSQSSER